MHSMQAAEKDPAVQRRALAILTEAESGADNPERWRAALRKVEELITSAGRLLPLPFYVRGRILSALGVPTAALTAYEEALTIDPNFAAAHYSAGVLLADLQRADEALQHWQAALTIEPAHVDACYNAAQLYYRRGDFAQAEKLWQRALQLAPTDLEIHKKLVQVYHALGESTRGAQAQAELRRLWEQSRDPSRATQYVVDQFSVALYRVLAYEVLQPASTDLYYVYIFRLLGEKDRAVMTVQLESSAYGRERGVPYLMGVTQGSAHRTTGPSFTKLPSYGELKPIATRLLHEALAAPRTSLT